MPRQKRMQDVSDERRCTHVKRLSSPVLVSLVLLSACKASLSRENGSAKIIMSQKRRTVWQPWPRALRSLSNADNKSLPPSNFKSTHPTERENNSVAKKKINNVLRQIGPNIMCTGMVLGTATITGGVLQVLCHLHRNQEATRRAMYFWSRAGPMVAHSIVLRSGG